MDLRTVIVWNAIFFTTMALLLWILYFTLKPRQAALRCWASAYTSIVLGSVFIALRGTIPVFWSIVFGNLFLVMPLIVIRQGIRTLRGKRPQLKTIAAVAILYLVWQTWFTLAVNSLVMRALFFSSMQALLAAALIAEALSPDGTETPGIKLVISGLGAAFGLTYVFRVALIVVNGLPSDILRVGSWDSFIHTAAAMILGSLALPLVFLIVSRLNGELSTALDERELLLREMTHRIKNDLTLVDSLISLQQGTETDERHARTLDGLRERIRSIASAHDLFSRHGGDMGKIDVDSYFDAIADGLPASPNILIRRDFADAEVPFKTALYLGLLLNELATNAIKYAFPDGKTGTLRLSFKMEGSNGRLEVQDDGAGMIWPPADGVGLGASIVESMVQSLKGTLRFENDGGSYFSIAVPMQAAKAKSP